MKLFLWSSDNKPILLLSKVPHLQVSKHWRNSSKYFPTSKKGFEPSPRNLKQAGSDRSSNPGRRAKGAGKRSSWRGPCPAQKVPRSDPGQPWNKLGWWQLDTETRSTGMELPWCCGDGKNSRRNRMLHSIEMYFLKMPFSESWASLAEDINSRKHCCENSPVLGSQKPQKSAPPCSSLPPRGHLCPREKQLHGASRKYIWKFNSHKYLLQLAALITWNSFSSQAVK